MFTSRTKKALCMICMVSLLSATFASCNITPSEQFPEDIFTNGQNTNTEAYDTSNNGSVNPPNGENSPEEDNRPAVYREYPNLKEIGTFHNGLAPFIVVGGGGETYGFIDSNGNIVIEPMYYTDTWGGDPACTLDSIPTFKGSNYVSVCQKDTDACLYDKTGSVIFSVGSDGVTDISLVSNGYVAVERTVEEFTGNVHSVTYYSATDLKEIITFENTSFYVSRGHAAVSQFGSATLKHDEDGSFNINMADYDPNFKAHQDTWTVDVKALEAFQGVRCEYIVSENHNTSGQIATVVLRNKDNIYYYATVDQNGQILMEPRKDIIFAKNAQDEPIHTYCKDLCPAQDPKSELWGYVDTAGNWKIPAQYVNVLPFGVDGYATVDFITVIDTNNTVVMAPQTIHASDIYGKFTNGTSYITFDENGSISLSYSGVTSFGKYQIQSGMLVVSGIGYSLMRAINPNGSNQDGTHAIQLDGNKLVINGQEWERIVPETTPAP